jgi:hypothetical protein
MSEIEEDEAFVQAHLAALGKLTTAVEDVRFQATLQIKMCKEMKAQGTYLLAQLSQSVDRAERLLSSHEKWVGGREEGDRRRGREGRDARGRGREGGRQAPTARRSTGHARRSMRCRSTTCSPTRASSSARSRRRCNR